MADVTLSNAVRSNLLSLQKTADLLGKTQERLSTGLKVNSALDDPTAFFTASSLNSRAGDLNRLLDSVGNAVQTVEAANDGLSAITKLVETAQATARQALQKPGAVVTPAAAATAVGSTFAADDVGAVSTGVGDIFAADTAAVGTGTVIAGGDALQLDNDTPGTDLNLTDGDTLTITVGGVATVFEIDTANNGVAGTNTAIGDTNQTLAAAITEINSVVGAALTVADVDGGGDSQIRFTATSNADDIVISSNNGALLTALGINGVGTGTATTRTITPTNAAAAALTETNFGVSVGSGNLQTVDVSGVTNRRDLIAALNAGTTGVTFSATGSNLVATADTVDNLTITNGTALGLSSSTTTNAALTALTNTFTVNIDGAGAQNVDLSTVNSVATLTAAVTGAGGAVSAGGQISFTSGSLTGTVVIGGDVTSTGLTAQTYSPTAETTTNNADRASLEAQFNNLLTQIDALAGDASFNGVNLLNGDSLSVIFNENNTSSLSITGVTFNSAGLGITAAATDDFQSNATLNAQLATLDTAVGTLRQQASTFGSNLSVVEIRQDFTKNLINTLETGAANLTLADTNEEGANTLALQTRQQLSSVALSLASQADQNVLRLF